MSKHEWVGAGLLILDTKRAATAAKSGKVTIVSKVTLDILDVYCRKCRRQYAAANGDGCVLASQHIGGPRRQPDPLTLEIAEEWPDPHDPLL